MRYLVLSKKIVHYSCEGGIENLSLVIIVCHHSTSLVMPIGDPRDTFFDPTLTLMMDSYTLYLLVWSAENLAIILEPDHAQQNVWPGMDTNYLTL